MRFFRRKKKVFVIGRNKTGSTSLGQALSSLGYRLGDQSKAELLMDDWLKRDFRNIVNYCKTADAFQDVPFSIDYTFQIMDYTFPGSKFILSIRNDSQEWFDSLSRFHTRIIGKNRLPTADDMKKFHYREKGWLWRTHKAVYGIDEHSLYNREKYIQHYESHNKRVREYFRYRKNDLLVLNLSDTDAMKCLCEFLGVPDKGQEMPHLNRSKI